MDAAFEPLVHQQTDGPRAVPSAQTLTATAIYHLSETGRKALLLAGGNGKGVQRQTVQVPVTRLHLVSVGVSGSAKLKLQPRFERVDGRIVRHDTPPVYDAPPTLDELLREAAKNYELSREYRSERDLSRDAYLERRLRIAQAFLDDPSQRAMMFPPPNPARCFLNTADGRVLFDSRADTGLARDVPREAYRRFRSDIRAKRERGKQENARTVAQHEEKQRVIAAWVAQKGTEDQRRRHEAGALPIAEVIDALTNEAFASVADVPRHPLDGAERLQAHLRAVTGRADLVVPSSELAIVGADVAEATAAEWAVMHLLKSRVPDADVVLREHRLSWRRDPSLPSLCVYGVLATRRVGPFVLRREFAVPAR
ncbi:MAG: hypothetical protein AB7U25_11890 [Vicinamibacterales bacterium]